MASSTKHNPLYLDSAEEVDRFLARIAGVREIALDTEGASFHRFVDRIYLLQLSTHSDTAVIDPLPIGKPAGLGAIVEDPSIEVVFHDADYDLRLLEQDYGWHVRNIFDTRIAAQLLGLKAFGLAALLERYFGMTLDKKHQRADWSMRPLTAAMLDYAAQDTMYLLDLRDRLRDELARKGRLEWAREEFARLEGTRWEPEDAAAGFMRIKGARDLDRRELAIFGHLVQWRDALAKELDRSTFRVVGNDALLEAARLRPSDVSSLLSVKGMPRGIGERNAGEILAAIRRGEAIAEADLPRFPRAPRWDKDPDFDARVAALRTVRDAAATRLELDPGVLCARDRLEAVARKAPKSIEELQALTELRRWQIAELGEGFVDALAKVPVTPPSTGGEAGGDGTASSRRRRSGRGRPRPEGGEQSPAPGAADDRSPYRDG